MTTGRSFADRLHQTVGTRKAGERRVWLVLIPLVRVSLAGSYRDFFSCSSGIFWMRRKDRRLRSLARHFFFACPKTAIVGRAACLPFLVSRRGARRQAGSLPYAGFQGPLAARVAGLGVTAILAFFGVHPKKVRLVRAATGSRFGVAVPKLSLWRQQFDVSRSPNGGSEHRVFE